MKSKLSKYFKHIKDVERRNRVRAFHETFQKEISQAKGSNSKHQAWAGGYEDHISMTLDIATMLFAPLKFEINDAFTLESAVVVLLFHDIEKIFKYSDSESKEIISWSKDDWYEKALPDAFGITFTEEELNALKYIHGENEDYSEQRMMNELAGFCHACDVLSARTFHNKKQIKE